MMSKKSIVIILSVCVCAFLFIIPFAIHYRTDKPKTSNGVEWNGEQDIAAHSDTSYIALPGFSKLIFTANQKNQKVNLYNPDVNTCTMEMQLELSDGTLLWYSDNIQPEHGFYEIELLVILDKGIYENCHLIIKCFDKQGVELNGGIIQFTLQVY